MPERIRRRVLGALAAAVLLLLTACTSGGTLVQVRNGVEIMWDTWGTPHVFAGDEPGLFRGFGYAQAQSHGQLLLRLMAQARGVAAEFGGESFVASDRAVRTMGLTERGAEWYAAQSPEMQLNIEAFATGINEFATDHPDQIGTTFASILPITGTDVMAHVARLMFTFLADTSGCSAALPTGTQTGPGSAGSNAWAIGPKRTASGNAMLLANPHLAWGGEQLFYEAQLSAPQYALYGAALVGVPVLLIGFDGRHGWTHTVNPIDACDLYQLTPQGNGYRFDGRTEQFATGETTIKVRTDGGTVREERLTLRRSVHGPVVESAGKLVAIRMAAVGATSTPGLVQQWWDMGRAQTGDQFREALRRNQLPMFNVIYADADKHVYAAFAGQVPRRPDTYPGPWSGLIPGESSALLWNDVLGFDELPQVADPPGGFVQNSNSAPWSFTYPLAPELDPGRFPPYVAGQSLLWRERRGLRMIDEAPLLTLDALTALKYNTRLELADRLLPELLDAARASGDPTATMAADVLAGWDRNALPDSTGTLLFYAFVQFLDPALPDSLFTVPADRGDPLNTPRGLADSATAVAALVKAADAIQQVHGKLDVRWGDVARMVRGPADLPANGMAGDPYGVFRVLTPDPDTLSSGEPAPVGFGDGFVAEVEFGSRLQARVLTTYGNSSQPGDPHNGDQLAMSAAGELRQAWLTRIDVEANLERRDVLD